MQRDALQVFIDVVRSGSFSEVARERELSPSSVARIIGLLEADLGVRLLQRSTRKIGLTEAGMLVFERTQPLLDELMRIQAEVKDLSVNPKGSIRITASPSFGTLYLAPLLAEFSARYPEITLDLVLDDKISDLVDEKFDLAIRQGPLPDSNLIAERLLSTRYRVCASPAYISRYGAPETPENLAQHRCLVFSLPSFRTQWKLRANNGTVSAVEIHHHMQTNNGMVLRQWALAGLGVVLLSDWLINKALDNGDLVDLFPTYDATATDFDTKIWLVYPSRNFVPAKVKLLAGFLKDKFLKT